MRYSCVLSEWNIWWHTKVVLWSNKRNWMLIILLGYQLLVLVRGWYGISPVANNVIWNRTLTYIMKLTTQNISLVQLKLYIISINCNYFNGNCQMIQCVLSICNIFADNRKNNRIHCDACDCVVELCYTQWQVVHTNSKIWTLWQLDSKLAVNESWIKNVLKWPF